MGTITFGDFNILTSLASADYFAVWDNSAGEPKIITLPNAATSLASELDFTSQNIDCTTLDASGDVSVGDNLTVGSSTVQDSGTPVWIIEDDTSAAAVASASLAIERDTEAAISLLTDTGGLCRIYAGDTADNDAGIIEYDHSNQRWEIWTETTMILRIETGHVRPNADNTIDLGSSGQAWKDVYYEGTLNDTSDRRYKTDIIDEELGLDFIRKLKPTTFVMKSDPQQLKHHGFIAQDIEATGDAFHGVRLNQLDDGSDKYTLDYTQIIAPLVKAVQEMAEELEQYRGEM